MGAAGEKVPFAELPSAPAPAPAVGAGMKRQRDEESGEIFLVFLRLCLFLRGMQFGVLIIPVTRGE